MNDKTVQILFRSGLFFVLGRQVSHIQVVNRLGLNRLAMLVLFQYKAMLHSKHTVSSRYSQKILLTHV